MFLKDDIVFSYSTRQAIDDGVLIKIPDHEIQKLGIKVPVYFTDSVYNRYVKCSENNVDELQLSDRIQKVFFGFKSAGKDSKSNQIVFSFYCHLPSNIVLNINEKCLPSLNHRIVKLKAVISSEDIDISDPAIFIMLPWED
jgi:hypothetical protein